jgi:hypothetical protein
MSMTENVPPGSGKEDTGVEAQIKSQMRRLGRLVKSHLPPGSGFVILAFSHGVAGEGKRTHYVANCNRADVAQLMREWLANVDEHNAWKDVPTGETKNELSFERWWAQRELEEDLNPRIRQAAFEAWTAARI